MDYFDIPAVSASGINKFLLHSPAHFWAESPLNPNRVRTEPTAAMIFGSLCHKLLLEPLSFAAEFAVSPEVDRRTNAGKATWSQFCEQNSSKRIVTQDQFGEATIMVEALRRHPTVFKLLGQGSAEAPLQWTDEATDLTCKGKADYYRNGLLLDYKTSINASPSYFCKAISNMGYHRQAAWYLHGVEMTTGTRPDGFVFIVQDKSLPEAIGIYEIDSQTIEKGQIENDWVLAQIKRRLALNDWAAFPPTIQTIGLPAWYSVQGGEDE